MLTKNYLPVSRRELFSDVESLFDSFFNNSNLFNSTCFIPITDSKFGGYPRLNIVEIDDKYIIDATVPGMDKEDLDIVLDDKYLKISGNKRENAEYENGAYHHREIKCTAFERTVKINTDNVDTDSIVTKLDKGILRISIDKKTPESKKIQKILIE